MRRLIVVNFGDAKLLCRVIAIGLLLHGKGKLMSPLCVASTILPIVQKLFTSTLSVFLDIGNKNKLTPPIHSPHPYGGRRELVIGCNEFCNAINSWHGCTDSLFPLCRRLRIEPSRHPVVMRICFGDRCLPARRYIRVIV